MNFALTSVVCKRVFSSPLSISSYHSLGFFEMRRVFFERSFLSSVFISGAIRFRGISVEMSRFLSSSIVLEGISRDFSGESEVVISGSRFFDCRATSTAGGALYCYNLNNVASIYDCIFVNCSCTTYPLANPLRSDYSGGAIAYVGKRMNMKCLIFERCSTQNGYGRSFAGYSSQWNASQVLQYLGSGGYAESVIAVASIEADNINSTKTQVSIHSGFKVSYNNPYFRLKYYQFSQSGGQWSYHINTLDNGYINSHCNFVNTTQTSDLIEPYNGRGLFTECYFHLEGNKMISSRSNNQYTIENCQFSVSSIIHPVVNCQFDVIVSSIYPINYLCTENKETRPMHPRINNVLFQLTVLWFFY